MRFLMFLRIYVFVWKLQFINYQFSILILIPYSLIYVYVCQNMLFFVQKPVSKGSRYRNIHL